MIVVEMKPLLRTVNHSRMYKTCSSSLLRKHAISFNHSEDLSRVNFYVGNYLVEG